jgi:hypothetical protein
VHWWPEVVALSLTIVHDPSNWNLSRGPPETRAWRAPRRARSRQGLAYNVPNPTRGIGFRVPAAAGLNSGRPGSPPGWASIALRRMGGTDASGTAGLTTMRDRTTSCDVRRRRWLVERLGVDQARAPSAWLRRPRDRSKRRVCTRHDTAAGAADRRTGAKALRCPLRLARTRGDGPPQRRSPPRESRASP